MPGVTAGDIGPKMGYNAVDNGFLRFDHVRVPRRAMLMRHARVDEDGTYHPPPVAKAAYGTMVFVRSDIVMNAALYMKKAVTIAMRYNLVRRQSNPGGETSVGETGTPGLELQVIDYQHSQRSLFPVLRLRFTARRITCEGCTSGTRRRAARTATSPRFPSSTPRPVGSRRTARGPRRTPSSCAGCAAAGRVHGARGVRHHIRKLRAQRHVRGR